MTTAGYAPKNNSLKFCFAQIQIYLPTDKLVYFSYFLSTSVALNMLSFYQLFHDFEHFLHVNI